MQLNDLTAKQRRATVLFITALFILLMFPILVNTAGLQGDVRHYTVLPLGTLRHASPDAHAWWLSAFAAAAIIGVMLIFMLGRFILGLGATNAAVIVATLGIMGGSLMLNRGHTVYYGGPAQRCIVFAPGGFGANASPAAAPAPAPSPSPAGVGGV